MGFDEELRDSHRVYWLEKRKVSIKRSVKFNFKPDEVIIGDLLLEGEQSVDEHLSAIEPKTTDQVDHPGSIVNHPEAVESGNLPISIKNLQNRQANPDVKLEALGGRGKQVSKETEYIRMLREGSAVTGMRGGLLLKGIQHGRSLVEQDIEHAMATMIERAQGLKPSYAEAKRCPDWLKWEEAIRKELKGLNDSGTWRLVKHPPNTNMVDSKWVFRIKKNVVGEVDKYKARLVARGFTQIYGVDYYEMYSPVARLASFQLLMAIAAHNGWTLDNFDFNQAFLNSVLGEDKVIYLEQLPRYETKDREQWVYRLLKSLYGLKQGSKNWYDALHNALVELGFARSKADHGVFFKQVGDDIVIF